MADNETNSGSPEKLMHQTKELLNIGTMMVVGPPSSADKQSEEVRFYFQGNSNNKSKKETISFHKS